MKENKNKVIYVISEGQYSDRHPIGYVRTIEEAESYCVGSEDNAYYDYRSFDAMPLFTGIETKKLYFRHEIVFDLQYASSGFCGKMRKEPNRYAYSIDIKGHDDIEYKGFGWIAFFINSDSRDRSLPEKIAQDLFAEFLDLRSQFGTEEAYKQMKRNMSKQ